MSSVQLSAFGATRLMRGTGRLLPSDAVVRNDRSIRECPAGRSPADQAVGAARRFTLMHVVNTHELIAHFQISCAQQSSAFAKTPGY